MPAILQLCHARVQACQNPGRCRLWCNHFLFIREISCFNKIMMMVVMAVVVVMMMMAMMIMLLLLMVK